MQLALKGTDTFVFWFDSLLRAYFGKTHVCFSGACRFFG